MRDHQGVGIPRQIPYLLSLYLKNNNATFPARLPGGQKPMKRECREIPLSLRF